MEFLVSQIFPKFFQPKKRIMEIFFCRFPFVFFFGRIENSKSCFRDLLTFRNQLSKIIIHPSNGLAQEIYQVHMVKGLHGPLEQDHWRAEKVDLTRSRISKNTFNNSFFKKNILLYILLQRQQLFS